MHRDGLCHTSTPGRTARAAAASDYTPAAPTVRRPFPHPHALPHLPLPPVSYPTTQASPVKVAAAAVVSLTSSVATTWALRRRGVEPVYSLLPLCMQVGRRTRGSVDMWVSRWEGPRRKRRASCVS